MKLRNLTQNLLLAGATLAVMLVMSEVLLRLFFPIEFSMEVRYLPDDQLGIRLQPGETYRLKDGGTCTVNGLGFRGAHETTVEKPVGTVRIVAFGGSSTFSYQTDDASIWTVVLESRLREAFGPDIEVINAGVPGYSIRESTENYRRRIRQMDPDVAIVYHTWNDMKFYVGVENGQIPEIVPYTPSRLKSVIRRFQLGWRVRNFMHDVVYAKRRENTFSASAGATTSIAANGPAHRWEARNYAEMASLLEADSVLTVFASQAGLLSRENLDDPDVRAVIYAEYQNMTFETILEQWLATSQIIRSSAEEHGALFVDAYNGVPHTIEYFLDHVHLTPRGNTAVAEVIFDGLRSDDRFVRLVTGR